MKPKVSVIVPVYKVECYLDRCVQSIRNQTLRDIEIILVDDGSPDKCPAMCDDYARLDSRIKVVHKQNAGLGMACNSGLEVATGEYIAFCDSDDWVDKDMYETMYQEIVRSCADMAFCGIRQVDQNGIVIPMSCYESYQVLSNRDAIDSFAVDMIANDVAEPIERSVPMSAKVVLYNKSFLIENKITFKSEREYITEDLIFNLDCLSKATCIIKIPHVFYNYFVNTQSISRAIRIDRFEKIKTVYHLLLIRYTFSAKGFPIRCKRLLIGYTRVALCQLSGADMAVSSKFRITKQICGDDIWREINSDYPFSEMSVAHRIFQFMVNKRIASLILLLCRLKALKK